MLSVNMIHFLQSILVIYKHNFQDTQSPQRMNHFSDSVSLSVAHKILKMNDQITLKCGAHIHSGQREFFHDPSVFNRHEL